MNVLFLIQYFDDLTPSGKKSQKNSFFNDKKEERWKELFLEAQKGNADKYQILLEEMYDYLNIFCRRYLYSQDLVEDCVQNSLLAIHKSKHTFNPSKSLKPWFFTIVRNKITDQLRKNRKNQSREVLESDWETIQGDNQNEINFPKELESLLPKLNPINLEAFKLTQLENKSILEASRLLKIGESAVKVRAHRATKELKKLIKEEFEKKYI